VRRVIQRENDGVRWQLQADFAPLLDPLLKSSGQMIKESAVKQVTLHRIGDRTFYVKRYLHHAVPLRPLKFFLKPSQARQEWTLAQELDARGVPIVRHLALGERRTWRGVQESILVTEGFDGVPLGQAPGLDPAAVLDFVQGMHACGVLQRDLHPGNLLVRPEPFELRLVDLHGIHVQAQVSAEDRQENLALLRVFLPVRVSPDIERRSRTLRQDLLYERSRRTLRRNRDFAQLRLGGLKWHVRLCLVDDAVRRVLNDPDGFLETRAQVLKPGRSSTVGRADGLVLKRFNFRKIENIVKDLVRPARARRAFRAAYHLELVGIPTARPIATAARRGGGLLFRSYLLMEEIAGATELGAYLRASPAPPAALVQQAARLIARLHEEGFSHRDLKETNLVLDREGRLYLLDLDGLKFLRRVPARRAAADLERLARGVAKYSAVTAQHRRLFLRTYCRARSLQSVPREE